MVITPRIKFLAILTAAPTRRFSYSGTCPQGRNAQKDLLLADCYTGPAFNPLDSPRDVPHLRHIRPEVSPAPAQRDRTAFCCRARCAYLPSDSKPAPKRQKRLIKQPFLRKYAGLVRFFILNTVEKSSFLPMEK